MRRRSALIMAAATFLLSAVGSATAATYRWIDDDGVVNLSNNPARYEAYTRKANPDQGGAAPASIPQSPPAGDASNASKPMEGAGPRVRESLTTEVMRLAGLDFQIELLAAMVRGEFERWWSLGFRPGGGAASIVARTFSAEILRSNMHESLAQHLAQERTSVLLAWLRSPLSQRIVALESAPPSADRERELADFINQLPSRPPTPARLSLIQRLERAGEVTDSSAVVAAAAVAALRRTMAPFAAPGVMTQSGVDGQQAGTAIDENYRFRIMTSLLFTYRDLRDAELGRYVSVLESPTGRWFTQVTRVAFLTSLEAPAPRERTGGSAKAATRRTR